MNEHIPEAQEQGTQGEQAVAQGVTPAETDAKLAEMEDRWLRAAADLDNLRKRISRDAERIRAEERSRVVAEFLPVLDNLELALSHADRGDNGAGAVLEGVRAVRDQAVTLLAKLGYPRDDETGVPFDPARHEAAATVEREDADPGTVVEVMRAGYGGDERQLRPAIVAVARKAE
jgi:molecular chaperone GrpE